jgi:threonine/homoserine/homoserine lactone efflux protein
MGALFLYIIQGVAYGFAAAVQPGPLQTYVISQALNAGWRRALPAAFSPLVSDGPIIVLVLLVLSRVPGWFQSVLYAAGGLFILYLARNAYLGWRDFQAGEVQNPPSGRRSLLRGAAMNVLNPGPYIYWSLVTGPILVAGWRQASSQGIGFLAGFYGALIASLGAIIVVFATARRLGPRLNRALLAVSAVALLAFGVYQLWRGVSGLVLLLTFQYYMSF